MGMRVICYSLCKIHQLVEECLSKFDLGSGAEARDHLRFFVDGLVIGDKDKVQEWLLHRQHRGTYRRRKNPYIFFITKPNRLNCYDDLTYWVR